MKHNTTSAQATRTLSRKTRLVGLLAVAVSAVALVPAGASASSAVPAKASLHAQAGPVAGGLLTGQVTTKTAKLACMANRPVIVEYDLGGGNFVELTNTTTDSNGKFQINVADGSYRFTAEATSSTSPHGQKVVCAPATSKVRTISH